MPFLHASWIPAEGRWQPMEGGKERACPEDVDLLKLPTPKYAPGDQVQLKQYAYGTLVGWLTSVGLTMSWTSGDITSAHVVLRYYLRVDGHLHILSLEGIVGLVIAPKTVYDEKFQEHVRRCARCAAGGPFRCPTAEGIIYRSDGPMTWR